MIDKKIILLCNNKIAFHALKELLFYKLIAVLVIPYTNKDVIAEAKEIIIESGTEVPLITVSKNNFIQILKQNILQLQPLAVLMMTFPFIIPEEILSLPQKGFINFHYGKLPQYRGAEPIFTQVLLQEKQPSLTVHIVDKGVDTGAIILQEIVLFNEDDTYASLQNNLAKVGAKVIGSLIKILSFGKFIPAIPQDENLAAYHKKPTAADLMINWQTMSSHQIKALVNACNPWNKGCGAKINNTVFGITQIEILDTVKHPILKSGTITCLNKQDGLLVCTSDEKIIKINIIYTINGFESGYQIEKLGGQINLQLN